MLQDFKALRPPIVALRKVIGFVSKLFVDRPMGDATSASLEERKFQADQEQQRAERNREDKRLAVEEQRLQADLEHQQAERAREDEKLKFRYHLKAGALGPSAAGVLAFLSLLVVQSCQRQNAIFVEKQRFEGDVILHSLNASDSDHAKQNLQFVLDINFIPDYADQIGKIVKDKKAFVPFNPPPQVLQLPKPDVVVAPSYKDAPEQYEWRITSRSFSGIIPDGFTCKQYIARWNEALFSPDDKILTCQAGAWRGKPPYPPIFFPDSGVFFEKGKPPRRAGRCEDDLRAWALNESREAMFNPNFKPPQGKNPTCVPLKIQ